MRGGMASGNEQIEEIEGDTGVIGCLLAAIAIKAMLAAVAVIIGKQATPGGSVERRRPYCLR